MNEDILAFLTMRVDQLERKIDRLEHVLDGIRTSSIRTGVDERAELTPQPDIVHTSPIIRDPDILAQEQTTGMRGHSSPPDGQ